MPDNETLWTYAAVLVVIGLPFLVFGRQIARWNRRVSRNWGWWNVPDEGEPGHFRWTGRYHRILGGVFLVAGLVAAVIALFR